MKKTLILYGISLAALITILRYLEYRYLLRDISMEIYIGAVAICFTVLGIWLATKLFKGKNKIVSTGSDSFTVHPQQADEHKISGRELEVLHLLARGLSNQEIADQLFVSLHTVKSHTSSLYMKLNVNRRTAAIRKARELKLLS